VIRRDPARFNLGDTVYHFDYHRRMTEVEVIKIGRALVTVAPPGETDPKSHRAQQFRIETGYLNDPAGRGTNTYIRTLAEHADDQRRTVARKRLEEAGVRIERHRGSGSVHLTPETIHAIVDLIEADTEYNR
jgi:hypothetical protein